MKKAHQYKNLDKNLDNIKTIADSLSRLFFPYVEVVIHSLREDKILHIAGNFSKRKVGESSYLGEDIDNYSTRVDPIIGPYKKVNYDGKSLKSISSIFYEENDQHKKVPLYLICINFDTTQLKLVENTLSIFLSGTESNENIAEIFKEDWQEKINIFVHSFLKERSLTIKTANKKDKIDLIKKLNEVGALGEKNSIKYIASVLEISRATFYSYLSQ